MIFVSLITASQILTEHQIQVRRSVHYLFTHSKTVDSINLNIVRKDGITVLEIECDYGNG